MSQQFPRSMVEFEDTFSTESDCRDYLFSVRWPDGWRCPSCDAKGGWRNRRGCVQCPRCGFQSSLTAGTVFHGTKKPLRLWFKAIFLMVTQKNGVSAKAIQHLLGVSYPTAWTWLHKLRRAMASRPHDLLSGVVEADETYWGGHREGEVGRRKGGGSKDLVVAVVEEDGAGMGRARLCPAPDHTGESLAGILEERVEKGSAIRTDGLRSYAQVAGRGYAHAPEVIGRDASRAAKLFPRVHRVVSLFKRWLLGTHQGAPTSKHLGIYLEEFEFRFNRRNAKHRSLLFESLVKCGVGQAALPYWKIIQREKPSQPLYVAGT